MSLDRSSDAISEAALRAPRVPSFHTLRTEPPDTVASTRSRIQVSRAPRRPGADTATRYLNAVLDGRYVIERVIGEGGMGMVFQARRTVIDKLVAIKVLHPALAKRADVLERFVAEAKAASAIGSPHIADVIDFGQVPDGPAYIVMEYLEGELLSGLVRRTALRIGRALEITMQIAEGLHAAHEAGIVHRDLKPDNVIVIQQRGSDFVKILDFGVAKFAKLAGRITANGAVFGTPHYMAPEQALGGDVDCRADVYSLGVILYELVTGTLPFDAESPYRVMEQHVTVAPVPPSQRVPLTRPIPACLEALILKCMAKSPDQRFADMRDLIQELERAQSEVSPEATFAVRPPARIDSMPTVAERRELLSDCESLVPSRGTTEPPLWDESTTRGTVHDTGKTEGAARRRASLRRVLFAAILASAGLATLVRLSGLSDQVTAAAAPEFAKQGPNVNVAVVLAPIDASIYEGNVNLGPMPLTVPVSPDRPRVLEARRPGFDPKRFVLDGSATRVEIELQPTRGRLSRSP